MENIRKEMEWFVDARYGLFIHFGLYSILGRGEWVMNREQIAPEDYWKLADEFNPELFDADAICQLAVDGGMKYLVFTTMHHDGFRMYHSELTDFCSTKTASKRDFVQEIVTAARKHGLKIGLYHSLNNWYDTPNGSDALENTENYEKFIENTFSRIRELVTNYSPIDMLWYDGWWPFHADGWKAEEMNAMVRAIQPNIIINGRNGLPGDFATPEQHLTAPKPWRPWEACLTLNDHWGYHPGDNNWKTPTALARTLLTCARNRGNLLLNVGPRSDGSIQQENIDIIQKVGNWLNSGGQEAINATEIVSFNPTTRQETDRLDWDSSAMFTFSGNTIYATLLYPPEKQWTLTGLECDVESVKLAGYDSVEFTTEPGRLAVYLPPNMSKAFCPVLTIECKQAPSIYRTGGIRLPNVDHPRYDPCPPDIKY